MKSIPDNVKEELAQGSEQLSANDGGAVGGHRGKQDAAEIDSKLQNSVVRRCILKPKIQIRANFGGSCNGRCWYILWTFGLFYGHLVYFKDIWSILWTFGLF
jgi:hypothetical protein